MFCISVRAETSGIMQFYLSPEGLSDVWIGVALVINVDVNV